MPNRLMTHSMFFGPLLEWQEYCVTVWQNGMRMTISEMAELRRLLGMDVGLCYDRLNWENRHFEGTGGVSRENACAQFAPAFRDNASGQVETSRFADGSPAPVHVLEGLPPQWVAMRGEDNEIVRVIPSVEAGFVLDDKFYTRAEAADYMAAAKTEQEPSH